MLPTKTATRTQLPNLAGCREIASFGQCAGGAYQTMLWFVGTMFDCQTDTMSGCQTDTMSTCQMDTMCANQAAAAFFYKFL
jgi:hypothetical protein